MARSLRSRWVVMKGSFRVMKSAVIAAARQGTVTCGTPDRIDRISGVASGVLVIAVFNPVQHSRADHTPDDKVRRYLVYLEYWTLNLRPLMVYCDSLTVS